MVALQQSVGLRSVTDGEVRRATWHMDFVYQIGGISKAAGNLVSTFHNEGGDIEFTPDAIRVDRRVSMDKTIFGEDFAFLQSIAGASVPKLTIPAPSMVHYRSGVRAVVDESVYPDVEEFWADLSAAYADEVGRLAAQGCAYLQLDDTSLAYLNDPAQRAYVAERGEDADSMHLRYIALTNGAIGGRPGRGWRSPRTCAAATSSPRGSPRAAMTSWPSAVQLARRGRVLPRVRRRALGRLRAASVRAPGQAGGPRPGDHQAPAAGGVPDDLKRRIEEAAKYVPLDQLCLSGQCGFASTAEGNALTADDQKAKLELIVAVADDVWG